MTDILARIECHDPVQSHQAITTELWPFVKAQTAQGRPMVIEAKPWEDDLTQRQRGYYWAVVLRDVADGIVLGGVRYGKDAWHEYGKREFLPRKTKKVKVAGRKRAVVTTVIGSTNDLSVRQMGEYLERWMAFAAEHGVTVSEPLPPELRGSRRREQAVRAGNVDAETGEIEQVAA